jgi:CubicO group peptidase (beta-lactamase class C family)
MQRKTLLSILFSILVVIAASGQNQWPTQGWPTSTPKMVDLNADSLIFLDNELASGRYGHVDGMLITRHGKIAYEKSYPHDYAEIYKQEAREKSGLNFADPTGPYNYFNAWWHPFFHGSKLHTLQSVTKTITSIIIGAAIARNNFPDVNTPILKFFDTSQVKNIDTRKRNITIRHLLTMTAGFNWNENLPYSDPNNTGTLMEASCDWVKYTIDRPMADEPGKMFNYNSGETQLLAYIFRVATGTDIEEYATKYLFEPLGIKNFYWKRSPSGLVDSEGGLYLEKSDLAKIFYLYLKNGEWDNKQIINPGWIKQSVTPYIKVGQNLSYGYKWWLSSYGDNPAEVIWRGSGFGGQFPIIIPEYDMVVVFTAWDISPANHFPKYSPSTLLNKVLHSVNEYNNAKKID